MDRMPRPGETMHGNKFVMSFGGKGANQCVMAARMGARTCMVSMIGQDAFGKSCMDNFIENSVDCKGVLVAQNPSESTGIASIYVDKSGMNSIVVAKGTNYLLTTDDIESLKGDTIQRSKVVVCQSEIPSDVSLHALQTARKAGKTTVFNPAPASPSLDPAFLHVSDIFCVNETEAEIITSLPVETDEQIEEVAREIVRRGAHTCVMTLGARGCLLAYKEGEGKSTDTDGCDISIVNIPATPCQCVDSCGAGDAFLGALSFYLSTYDGFPPSEILTEMVTRAGAVATISVQSAGAQSSYPRTLPSELLRPL